MEGCLSVNSHVGAHAVWFKNSAWQGWTESLGMAASWVRMAA
jgi:hypothetical protein